jgi:hypothetical protein
MPQTTVRIPSVRRNAARSRLGRIIDHKIQAAARTTIR